MVDWWWAVIGAAIPAVAVQQVVKRINSERELVGKNPSPNNPFVCERVCTSKRMLNKVGGFSKDPSPNTCVTVCGLSELDTCIDACARTVCANEHHLPNWHDICLRRCQNQCLKLSPGSSP